MASTIGLHKLLTENVGEKVMVAYLTSFSSPEGSIVLLSLRIFSNPDTAGANKNERTGM